MYQKKTYRNHIKNKDLINYTVICKESDLNISSKTNLDIEALKYINKYRNDIISYADNNKPFYRSLKPITVDDKSANIVKHMAKASKAASVGPMATVAGAISHYVGNSLLKYTDEIVIENGGDIFLKCNTKKNILVHAGNSPFSNKIAISVSAKEEPLGICTSAGTVGHSLSFGNADGVVILSNDTLLADATATAIGNMVSTTDDINEGIEFGKSIKGIKGILIIIKDKLGAWGDIELVKL